MVAYVYVVFRKEDAEPHLDALTEEASRRAKQCGLNLDEQWWNYRGDNIVFGFLEGNKGRSAANGFWAWCILKKRIRGCPP